MATTTTVNRILDAARELFNERGVGSVSTRAIAERAGVSSGNLHYHFTDKEAVVRALMARRYALGDGMWVFPDGLPSVIVLRDLLRRNLEISWEYRFLNRELVSLTSANPEFSEFLASSYRDRMNDLRVMLNALIDAREVAVRFDEVEEALATAWLISEHWLLHLESIGVGVDPIRIEEGVDLVLLALGHEGRGRGSRDRDDVDVPGEGRGRPPSQSQPSG